MMDLGKMDIMRIGLPAMDIVRMGGARKIASPGMRTGGTAYQCTDGFIYQLSSGELYGVASYSGSRARKQSKIREQ